MTSVLIGMGGDDNDLHWEQKCDCSYCMESLRCEHYWHLQNKSIAVCVKCGVFEWREPAEPEIEYNNG